MHIMCANRWRKKAQLLYSIVSKHIYRGREIMGWKKALEKGLNDNSIVKLFRFICKHRTEIY